MQKQNEIGKQKKFIISENKKRNNPRIKFNKIETKLSLMRLMITRPPT